MESTLGEVVMKIVEMATEDLEYYINLVDKVVAWFKRIDPNCERSCPVGKMLSNSSTCYKEIVRGGVNHVANLIVLLF